jgi:hypothetical protein
MIFIKKNIVVILAFMLPILLIIGLAVSVYLPGVFLSTQYNFVYATCDNGSGDYQYYPDYPQNCNAFLNSLYQVENGGLVTQTAVLANGRYLPRLFVHDTKNNESREITFTEAESLRLSGLLTSPDGVSIDNGYNRGSEFFPFFGGSFQYGYYLTKGSKRHRLDLLGANDRYYSDNNFKFIGWVVGELKM